MTLQPGCTESIVISGRPLRQRERRRLHRFVERMESAGAPGWRRLYRRRAATKGIVSQNHRARICKLVSQQQFDLCGFYEPMLEFDASRCVLGVCTFI